jgi:hypothetical protein
MPRSAQTLSKLHKAFYQSKLKKRADPDVFIMYMEDMRARIEDVDQTMKMTDDHFMLHIVNNLTKDYERQVEAMEDKIAADTNPLTIEEMREILVLRFERLNDKQDSDDDNANADHALIASGQFKGRCRACGKYGHKSVDCRSRGSGQNAGRFQGGGRSQGGFQGRGNSGFSGACHYCKKIGHRDADCRKKKMENGEHANHAKEDKEYNAEIVLMAVDDVDAPSEETRITPNASRETTS